MNRMIRTIRAPLGIFAALALLLLYPVNVHSQQLSALASSGGADFNPNTPNASPLTQGLKPVAPDPFQRPASSSRKAASETGAADSLLLQLDRKWTTAVAQYAFAAPPEFYSCSRNQANTSDWDSVVSGALTAYVNRSYTTYLRVSSDFEMQGQRRLAGAFGEPGEQTLTMEAELAHLVPGKLGPMEVATGIYQQRLISYAAYANSSLTTPFLGYSGSAAGFETSITLPDKNITFTFRQGAEHANGTTGKPHATQFEFSWTW